jgi:hypothetical protein
VKISRPKRRDGHGNPTVTSDGERRYDRPSLLAAREPLIFPNARRASKPDMSATVAIVACHVGICDDS